METDPKKDFNAVNLLQEHQKDITGLGEKLLKCYSIERYEDFQTAVKKIMLEMIGSEEGRVKIKAHATESAKEYDEGKNETKKNFWTPNIIQIIIGVIALAGLAIAIFK